jgi:glyoxalase family protein
MIKENGASKGVFGIHHVTAIASDSQMNIDFYANNLGLRFVKLTVNQDDPYFIPSILWR